MMAESVIPDPPQQPAAPRCAITGPASRGFRAVVNEIKWFLYDLRFGLWRFIWFDEAEFIGGAADGLRYVVPRDAKTWVQPHRDGEDYYRRKRSISGTYFLLDRRSTLRAQKAEPGQPRRDGNAASNCVRPPS